MYLQTLFCEQFALMCIKMKDGVADETIHSIERMPEENMHGPAGAGYRNAVHYAQIIKNKKF